MEQRGEKIKIIGNLRLDEDVRLEEAMAIKRILIDGGLLVVGQERDLDILEIARE